MPGGEPCPPVGGLARLHTVTLLFGVLSSLALVSGLMVIRGPTNPVHSVLFLLLVFVLTSGLLLGIDLDFYAMVYLVVYAGAMVVFFLFVVMMCYRRHSPGPDGPIRHSQHYLIGLLLLWHSLLAWGDHRPTGIGDQPGAHTGVTVGEMSGSHLDSLGNLLYTYVWGSFLGSSLILLVAMLGAIVLTRR